MKARTRALLLPAFLLALPASSFGATCAVSRVPAEIYDAMMACEGAIGEAAAGLDSADPKAKAEAARRVAAFAQILATQESVIGTLKPANPEEEGLLRDARAGIADIKDVHGDELGRASQIATAPTPPPQNPAEERPAPGRDNRAVTPPPGATTPPPPGQNPPPPGGNPPPPGTADKTAGAPGAPGSPAKGGAPPPQYTGDRAAKNAKGAMTRALGIGEELKKHAEDDGTPNPGAGGERAGGQRPLMASMTAGAPTGADAQRRQLADNLATQPIASLMQPRFFEVLPRTQYDELKKAFLERLDLRDTLFKHIGLTGDDRDFKWTENCNKALDKDKCNKSGPDSYLAGKLVQAENLKAIFDALYPGDKKLGSYHEYFAEQVKAGKMNGAAQDVAYFKKNAAKFSPEDFDKAIALCLPTGAVQFDGAARTLDDVDAYARVGVFQCGVRVMQEASEVGSLQEQKRRQGAAFRGQARLDALLAGLEARGRQLAAGEGAAPLLAPGAKPGQASSAAPVSKDQKNAFNTLVAQRLSQTLRLVPMPGSKELADRAQSWYHAEANVGVVAARASAAKALVAAAGDQAPANVTALVAELDKPKADARKVLTKLERAVDGWLAKEPGAVPADAKALKDYKDVRTGAGSFYMEWLRSGAAGVGVSAEELGPELDVWAAPLGLDTSKVDRVAVDAVASLANGQAVPGWRFHMKDGTTMFVSRGGALTHVKSPNGRSEVAQKLDGKIKKRIEIPAQKTVIEGWWSLDGVMLDVTERREGGTPGVLNGQQVTLGKGTTQIIKGKIVLIVQEWTTADGLKHYENYNNHKYSSEASAKRHRIHEIHDYDANGNRHVTRWPVGPDGTDGQPKLTYVLLPDGKAQLAFAPFSEAMQKQEGDLGVAVYASEKDLLDGAVPIAINVELAKLKNAYDDERKALGQHLAAEVVRLMKWPAERQAPLATAFAFRTAGDAEDTRLRMWSKRPVGFGSLAFFVNGDQFGFRRKCSDCIHDFEAAGDSNYLHQTVNGEMVEPASFAMGEPVKAFSLVTYRPFLLDEYGKPHAETSQTPGAGVYKLSEYAANGRGTEFSVVVRERENSLARGGWVKINYVAHVYKDSESSTFSNAGRVGDPVKIDKDPAILSSALGKVGHLPVIKQVGGAVGHVAGWAYHNVLQSTVQDAIGGASGNKTYKLCAMANEYRGHGGNMMLSDEQTANDFVDKIGRGGLNERFTSDFMDDCMDSAYKRGIRQELMDPKKYDELGPSKCRKDSQDQKERVRFFKTYCSGEHVAKLGGNVGAALKGLDTLGEMGANMVLFVPAVGAGTSLLVRAERFGAALADGAGTAGRATTLLGRTTQFVGRAGELYLHGGMMTDYAKTTVNGVVVTLGAAADGETGKVIDGLVEIGGGAAGMRLAAGKPGAKKGVEDYYESFELTGGDVAAVKPGFARRAADWVSTKWEGLRRPERGDVAPRPAVVETATPPRPSGIQSHDAVVQRFGRDPADPAFKGATRGGQGGGRAREVDLGDGGMWVLKQRHVHNRAREAAQNELLMREVVNEFYSETFNTTEAIAFENGEQIATINRLVPDQAKVREPGSQMTQKERADLSILSQVFGMSDRNYGNQLFGGGKKPTLIDFEIMVRRPRDKATKEGAAYEISVNHAPWVDRQGYNNPKAYKKAFAEAKKKIESPDFQAKLDAMAERAGLDKAAAKEYGDAIRKNLEIYEHNIDLYLEAANANNPKPRMVLDPRRITDWIAARREAKAQEAPAPVESSKPAEGPTTSPKPSNPPPVPYAPPGQKPSGNKTLAERRAYAETAKAGDPNKIAEVELGEAGDGFYGQVVVREPFVPGDNAQRQLIAEFNKNGFEVQFDQTAPKPDSQGTKRYDAEGTKRYDAEGTKRYDAEGTKPYDELPSEIKPPRSDEGGGAEAGTKVEGAPKAKTPAARAEETGVIERTAQERKDYVIIALEKYPERVLTILEGRGEKRGSVELIEPFDAALKAEFEREGFDVKFKKKPLPDPTPSSQVPADAFIPKQRDFAAQPVDIVTRREHQHDPAFDDPKVNHVYDGAGEAHGKVFLDEAYDPNSVAQKFKIKRFNDYGYQVSTRPPGSAAEGKAVGSSEMPTNANARFGSGPTSLINQAMELIRSFRSAPSVKPRLEFVKDQAARKAAFEKDVKVEPDPMTKLPKGVPPRLQKGFDAIRKLNSSAKPFDYLQRLEADVFERVVKTGENLDQARDAILGEWEARHGFKDAVTLPDRILNPQEFLGVLKEGALFKDPTFAEPTAAHGAETHRLQWHAVMRHMEAHPAEFGGATRASDYFKALGELDRASLDWSGTGGNPRDLWFNLFDSNEKNFSSPEFTYHQKERWPGLGAWD